MRYLNQVWTNPLYKHIRNPDYYRFYITKGTIENYSHGAIAHTQIAVLKD